MTEQHEPSLVERADETAYAMDLHETGGQSAVQWYFRRSSGFPVAVNIWTIPVGGSEGIHAHSASEPAPVEELYIVHSGIAEANVGGQNYRLEPGDAFLAPVDVAHDLRNVGDEPLRVFVVWGPTADRASMPIHNAAWSIVRAAEAGVRPAR